MNNMVNNTKLLSNYNIKEAKDKNNKSYYIIFDNNNDNNQENGYFLFDNAFGYQVVDNLFITNNPNVEYTLLKDQNTPLQIEYIENVRNGRTNRKILKVLEG